MRSKIIVVLYLLLMSVGMIGCISQAEDGKWKVSLSPTAAETIGSAGDAATSVLTILSAFIPGLAAAAGVAGGVTATYKKMKPKLTKNRAVSQHVVSSLETLKKEQPELWEEVKVYMKENTNADIEKVIDEIINLTRQIEGKENGKS